MGIILSLIAIPSQKIRAYRQKKKTEKVGSNYVPVADLRAESQQLGSSEPSGADQVVLSHNPDTAAGIQAAVSNAQAGAPVPLAVAAGPPSLPKNTVPATEPEGDKMATDEDYMAFLNKANEDPSVENGSKVNIRRSGGLVQLKTVDSGAQLPEEIRSKTESAEWIYVSDADEAFVGVSLRLKTTKLPDEGTFGELINYPEDNAVQITIMDISEWDSRGKYKEVVDAVRHACKGSDVRVYNVPRGGSRIEYWVVGVNKEESRLVGAKVLSIES